MSTQEPQPAGTTPTLGLVGPGRLAFPRVKDLPEYALLWSLIGILALCLIYPIVLTVRGGLAADVATRSGFSLEHIALVFQDPTTRGALLNSLMVACGTTTLACLIAVPLAVLAANYRFPGKSFFNALVLVPMILPPFVGAIGVRAILGRTGALNSLLGTDLDILGGTLHIGGMMLMVKPLGVMLLQALSLYPIIFLNTTASLANLDPALGECAENLGATNWQRFRRVTLPLIRPGIFAGATIVFIWSFTELGTPLMFDYYNVTPVQIFYGLKEVENSAKPYALTIVMLVMAIGIYVAGRALFGGRAHAMYSKASRAGSEKELTGVAGMLAMLAFGAVGVCAVMPHLGVVLTAITQPGQWYKTVLPSAFTTSHFKQALGAPDSFSAILNSLKFSSLAMCLNVLLGLLIAYLIVRTRLVGRQVLDALCMLPLAVPGLVLAFGFVAMSLRWPFKGGPLEGFASIFGVNPNPIPFLVMAYAVRRLPYIVRSTVAGLEQTSNELEEAAINLGASRLQAVRRVIVPLILANIIAGSLLVFSFSMLEVSDSLILAQQAEDYPVTKAILAFSERLGDGAYIASAMGVWGMALLTVTLLAASNLLGKKLGSIFRV